MKSKRIICGTVAAAIAISVSLSGCSLLSTINEEDMKQTIATVDLSKSEDLGDLAKYSDAVGETTIVKRDLVASFVNVGYTYVSSYGYTYAQTFELLVNSLTSGAVVTQYATMYMLDYKIGQGTITLAEYNAKTTEEEKYVYLLGGENSDGVLKAQYSLYSSINSSLDSFEESKLDEEETYTGTDTRSTPTNVDTEKEDYLPTKEVDGKKVLDYGIYTGYSGYGKDDAGTYEALDGSTKSTRRRAYSNFISSLRNNYLITSSEEDVIDVLKISYIRDEYVAQLQQQVVEEFYDIYEEEQEKQLFSTDNGVYTFVRNKYEELLNEQKIVNADTDSFETAMDSLSDTSFILYAPSTTSDTEEQNGTYGTFGYVYNILLPFSAAQSDKLEELDSKLSAELITEDEYYVQRNALLKDITTTDRRSAWFNGETDYSFDAGETSLDYYGKSSGRNYLFFENNLTKTEQYETLEKYTGLYSYNGNVRKNTDGSYTLIPQKLTIDDMLSEFSEYINYVLGTDSVKIYNGDGMTEAYSSTNGSYYNISSFKKTVGGKEVIDYSNFVYVTGKVNVGTTSAKDLLEIDSASYKVISAVNELQYAYTTDTGVLSQYIGYSVSAYDTSYIKEFEYAAQQAIRSGEGTFKVCAGQYGWHLIYVTKTFDFNGGSVYGDDLTWTEEDVTTEGTFQYQFYEWIKDSLLSSTSTAKRAEIIDEFSNDTTVTVYENTYKDLLELDS